MNCVLPGGLWQGISDKGRYQMVGYSEPHEASHYGDNQNLHAEWLSFSNMLISLNARVLSPNIRKQLLNHKGSWNWLKS